MQIIRQKSQPTATPDQYSISDVRVGFEPAWKSLHPEEKVGKFLLSVDLEPEGHFRERGFDRSYETKKNACTLRIEEDELERIQEALRQELKNAYQFLLDNKGLLEQYNKKQQKSPPSEADLLDK